MTGAMVMSKHPGRSWETDWAKRSSAPSSGSTAKALPSPAWVLSRAITLSSRVRESICSSRSISARAAWTAASPFSSSTLTVMMVSMAKNCSEAPTSPTVGAPQADRDRDRARKSGKRRFMAYSCFTLGNKGNSFSLF